MKKLYVPILIFFTFLNFFGQAPAIQWQKCYGGSAYEKSECVRQTNDGGFIAVGYTLSSDGDLVGHTSQNAFDYWIVKLNSSGGIVWKKTLGGTKEDKAFSVETTNDGGYIILGTTKSNDLDVTDFVGTTDIDVSTWIIKLNASGTIQWKKSYQGSAFYDELPKSIHQTSDGGYIFTGAYFSPGNGTDFWIVKLDGNGNITWQKNYGGTRSEHACSIQLTSDGGFIVVGDTNSLDGNVTGFHGSSSNGYPDVWVIKLNSSGDLQWQKTLGGSSEDYGYDVDQASDGGYIVAGRTRSFDGDVIGYHFFSSQGNDNAEDDAWIIKLDSAGNIEWNKAYGGSYDDGRNCSVIHTQDQKYVFVCSVGSYDGDLSGAGNYGNNNMWAVKLDDSGNILWKKAIGAYPTTFPTSIQQTTDNGFVISGYIEISSGAEIGTITGYHNGLDFFIVKLMPDTLANNTFESNDIKLFPNPTNGILNVQSKFDYDVVNIYDMQGRKLISDKSDTIDLASLASGNYILQGTNKGNQVFIQKFIKQ